MAQELQPLMRRLAERTAPEGTAITSVYLDARPEASGNRPGERTAGIILKDRLQAIEKSLLPRGPGLDSFRVDRDRIERAVAGATPAADGLAIFSCGAADLFEVVESGVPFDTKVVYQEHAALFPLARLADEFEPAVVAVADTNTVRVFSVRMGTLKESAGKDEKSIHFQKRRTGGLSQERYQRHIEKHRTDFAKEAAQVIARVVEEDGATRVVLSGDEVAIPLLLDALPRSVSEKLVGEGVRTHIRAPKEEVGEDVAAILELAEEESSRAVADALVAEVRKDALGVAGADPTRRALEAGQVDVLVMLDGYEPIEVRDEATRLAIATSATVEVVPEHEGLASLGGIGAILRWRW